ncbi:branched-chain amino acid ABC transporter ATP-binding protein [Dethiosulfatarculus sandiegensis]|uniref:Branched-chain amino acid ABC transporter ATP-binding protein n=2 Tax=Dethiosulfatarculus sandiegensis TaxID=1429043 RepID=A0A0D2HZ64_9BACT|nr:branched-chain amino acid ABC transporter ATP-binding protein [Dethiosulfatarculus sandiegensis]
MSLLEIKDACKRFGGVQAISEVSFRVEQGEILGLIGPNGAGKTTLFNLITGAIQMDRGSVLWDGREITGLRPDLACKAGISRTFQVTRPFGRMTCLENVYVPLLENQPNLKGKARQQESARLLGVTGLAGKEAWLAESLNLIDKKRLELARALAAGPRLILLDEVLGGLNTMEMQDALKLIKSIRDEYEMTVVWIEHIMGAIMSVCERVLVLDMGRLICQGEPGVVCQDPAVIEAYLGEQADA